VRTFPAFEPTMRAGVRVATAYVTDDVLADVVVATGKGVPDRVRVFSGPSGKQIAGPVGSFAPFGPGTTGGVNLAASNDPPPEGGSYDVPFDQTFLWSDVFQVDTENAAAVREVVTEVDEQTYRFSFTVTNTSQNGAAPNDLFDLGLGRFTLALPDTEIVEPLPPPSGWAVAVYTNLDGSGTIVWQADPSSAIFYGMPGVTFAFDSRHRPLVDGTGIAFDRLAQEQTAAAGNVVVPGNCLCGTTADESATFKKYEKKDFVPVLKSDWDQIVKYVHGIDPSTQAGQRDIGLKFQGYVGQSLQLVMQGRPPTPRYTSSVTVGPIPGLPQGEEAPASGPDPDLQSQTDPLVLVEVKAVEGAIDTRSRKQLQAFVDYVATKPTKGVVYVVTNSDTTIPAAGDNSPILRANDKKVGLYQSVAEVRAKCDKVTMKWTFELRVKKAEKLGTTTGTVQPLDAASPPVPLVHR
jgi:hypothetical protein